MLAAKHLDSSSIPGISMVEEVNPEDYPLTSTYAPWYTQAPFSKIEKELAIWFSR